MCLETFVLITIVNPSCSLYCNDHSLVRSINDTTIFCKVSGIQLHGLIIITMLFSSIFKGLCFTIVLLILPSGGSFMSPCCSIK